MYNITCNTDDKYAQHCMAMLCSLFENNKDELFTVHILCKSLSDFNRTSISGLASRYNQRVIYYNIDESKLEGVQFRKNRPLTKAAYYRLLLSSVLKNIDKVLYLDCDMIVLGKVKELFDIDLSNYALAAVLDGMPYNCDHQMQLNLPVNSNCFCSGIMMVNLAYWKNNHIEEKLISFAKRERNPVYLHDQDVLNYFLNKDWFMLPPKWNRNPAEILSSFYFKAYHYTDIIFNTSVIHYCHHIFKPWYNGPCPGKKYYKKYLNMSGYKGAKIEKLPLNKYMYNCYFYIRTYVRYIIQLYMPKLLVILFADVINLLRLIFYLICYLFWPKCKFVQRMSNLYSSDRMMNL